MKFKKIFALVTLSLSLNSFAAELCGYVTLEQEGTWLEVPMLREDNTVTHKVYSLNGAGVDNLEQGEEVCTEYEETLIDEYGKTELQVTKVRSWIRSSGILLKIFCPCIS